MDVTPPGAAGTASRPSRSTPPGIPLILRRLAIGLAGLALAVLAGVACALSFDDLRSLAIAGGAKPRLAYMYPTAFDVLLVVALFSVPLLRGGRLAARLQAGFVLLLMLASVAAATVVTATRTVIDPQRTAVTVALLPWVLLVIGLWLLLILMKHARAGRADLDDDGDDDELVPFRGERQRGRHEAQEPTAPYRAVAERPAAHAEHTMPHPHPQPHPVPAEHTLHSVPPLLALPEAVAPPDYVPPPPVSPVAETVAPPEYAPPLPVMQPEHTSPLETHTAGRPGDEDTEPEHPRPESAEWDSGGFEGPGHDSAWSKSSGAEEPRPEEAGDDRSPHQPVPAPHTPPPAPAVSSTDETADHPAMPLVPPTAAPRTPPIPDPPSAPESSQAVTPAPAGVPEYGTASESVAAAEPATTPETHRMTEPAATPEPSGTAEPVEAATTGPGSPEPTDTPPAPRRLKRDRPVRWGDLVRPHAGDVLVHPRPSSPGRQAPDQTPEQAPGQPSGQAPAQAPGRTPAPEGAAASPPDDLVGEAAADPIAHPVAEPVNPPADTPLEREQVTRVAPRSLTEPEPDEAGIDTQPLRQIHDAPDPAHAADLAEHEEQHRNRRKPYEPEGGSAEDGESEGEVPLAPPSGRMRSTPRPPA